MSHILQQKTALLLSIMMEKKIAKDFRMVMVNTAMLMGHSMKVTGTMVNAMARVLGHTLMETSTLVIGRIATNMELVLGH